jgi:hypothetical protein
MSVLGYFNAQSNLDVCVSCYVLFSHCVSVCAPLSRFMFRSVSVSVCWQWMLLFSVGLMGAMSPWWIRNFAITGKFVPTTLQVGASLYDGWHPGATGSSDENMDFVLGFLVDQKREDELLAKQGIPLESTFEWRADRRMRSAAIAWALENPSDVMRLGLLKLRKTWAPLPVAREVGQPWIRWSEGLGYGFLVLFAGYGAWLGRRERGLWLRGRCALSHRLVLAGGHL